MAKAEHKAKKSEKKRIPLLPDRNPGPRREWVDFEDHEEEDCTWRVDVTFLQSSWECIFGNGCPGIEAEPAPEKMIGCCSHGAYLTDKDDRQKVKRVAQELTPEAWQFHEIGQAKGIFVEEGKGTWRTRRVDGACIFLNRPGHPAGAGCVFHHLAERKGVHFSETKPEVCWQLPLHLENQEQPDGSMIWLLTEYGRSAWDEGGQDFGWWCTEEPEPFHGREPVYISMEAELRKMVGDPVYEEIREYLDARRDKRASLVAHPGEELAAAPSPTP